jgi:hypothetical protein
MSGVDAPHNRHDGRVCATPCVRTHVESRSRLSVGYAYYWHDGEGMHTTDAALTCLSHPIIHIQKLAAVVNGEYIYTSTNSGGTWTQRASGVRRSWVSIASSSDGTVRLGRRRSQRHERASMPLTTVMTGECVQLHMCARTSRAVCLPVTRNVGMMARACQHNRCRSDLPFPPNYTHTETRRLN